MRKLLAILLLSWPVLAQVQPGGTGVTSLNGKKGAITLAAGTGVTITPSGNTFTFASAGSSCTGSNGQFLLFSGGACTSSAGFAFSGTQATFAAGSIAANTNGFTGTSTTSGNPSSGTDFYAGTTWTHTAAGQSTYAGEQVGAYFAVNGGYTAGMSGFADLVGVRGDCAATSGQGVPTSGWFSAAGCVGVMGRSQSAFSTPGSTVRIGVSGVAGNATSGQDNYGVVGLATASNLVSQGSVGVLGVGYGGSGALYQVGVAAGLKNQAPSMTSTALYVDNQDVAAPIAIFRDNGTDKVRIEDGGNLQVANLTASQAVFTDASKNLASTGTSAGLAAALSDETGSGAAVFGTSPVIATPTISSQSSAAGVTEAFAATAPAQITTAQAGAAVTVNASNAVAGSSVAGAAAGGGITLTTGDGARLSSGSAAGGDLQVTLGSGIGGGRPGVISLDTGGGNGWDVGFNSTGTTIVFASGSIAAGFGATGTNTVVIGGSGAATYSGGAITAIGHSACTSATGANNTCLGYNSGKNGSGTNQITAVALSTGTTNTVLGTEASVSAAASANRTSIGYRAISSADNSIMFGNKSVTLFQLGSDSSDTQTARVLQAAGARASTDTDTAASPIVVQGGLATGTATSGAVIARTALPTTTGTTAQTATDRDYAFAGWKTLTESTATAVVQVAVASGTVAGGTLDYTIQANDASDYQALSERCYWSAVNKAGTVTASTAVMTGTQTAVSAGTLTNTCTAVANGNAVDIKLNAVSSLTQTTLRASWRLTINGGTGNATPQ